MSALHIRSKTGFFTSCSGRNPATETKCVWGGARCDPAYCGRSRFNSSEISCRPFSSRSSLRVRNEALDVKKLAISRKQSRHHVGFQKPDSELRSHLDRIYKASDTSPTIRKLEDQAVSTRNVPVYVMLPLDSVWLVEQDSKSPRQVVLRERAIEVGLEMLKAAGVEGVMIDVWWGMVEHQERKYDFSAYRYLFEMVASKGLKVQAVMSFHAAGGNVGDTCIVSLPPWVLDAGARNPDIFFTDEDGVRNFECLSLGCDEEPVLFGRTPIAAYSDFISSFVDEFSSFFGSTITDITIGMGPAGELRYPSYPEGDARWRFPGVGQFQCYDGYMMSKLKSAAEESGHPEWGLGGPHNAGSYNSRAWETGFFNDHGSWDSEYGDFFLTWYSEELISHADRLLTAANSIIRSCGRPRTVSTFHGTLDGGQLFNFRPAVQLSIKLAGVHWWYKTGSHAAELTAGYYNTQKRDGYARVFEVLSAHQVSASFTCVEMRDCEHPAEGLCSPEGLLNQVLSTAASAGVPVSGENALQRYDRCALDKIAESAVGQSVKNGRLERLTFLRLGDLMIDNWDSFASFLHRLAFQT